MTTRHVLPKILLIEDDAAIVQLVRELAPDAGVDLTSAENGIDGLSLALNGHFDAVLIDVNLPLLGGFEVCRQLRQEKPKLPILMLTSRADEVDKVLGLELGADDYVVKPFSSRELVARVKAVLRRVRFDPEAARSAAGSEERLLFGPLVIDLAKRAASLNGTILDLTPTELDLLVFLASNPGRAFTREQLVEEVWGYQAPGYDPTVTTHLSRLRRKIEPNPEKPMFLLTVKGVGYRFADRNEIS